MSVVLGANASFRQDEAGARRGGHQRHESAARTRLRSDTGPAGAYPDCLNASAINGGIKQGLLACFMSHSRRWKKRIDALRSPPAISRMTATRGDLIAPFIMAC